MSMWAPFLNPKLSTTQRKATGLSDCPHSGPAVTSPSLPPLSHLRLLPPPLSLSFLGSGVGLCFMPIESHLVKVRLMYLLHLLHICVCVFFKSLANSNAAFVWVTMQTRLAAPPCPRPGPLSTPPHLGKIPWHAGRGHWP